jgi:hypothetical protein
MSTTCENFGMFSMFWESAYGTLKHPGASVDEFAKGASLDELHHNHGLEACCDQGSAPS